jgi:hypothetical protein
MRSCSWPLGWPLVGWLPTIAPSNKHRLTPPTTRSASPTESRQVPTLMWPAGCSSPITAPRPTQSAAVMPPLFLGRS